MSSTGVNWFDPMMHSDKHGTSVAGLIDLPCGSRRFSSSANLDWNDVLVERHQAFARPAEESVFPDFVLECACGDYVAYGERAVGRGRLAPYSKPPGVLNFYTEGVRPTIRPTTTTDLIVCRLDLAFVAGVREECKKQDAASPHNRYGFQDPAVADLVSLLEAEARSGGATGRLFVEHITYALTARLVGGADHDRPAYSAASLAHPRLRRVIDRMRSNVSAAHGLEELAGESGYSRSQFLRLFRAAAQCTPHRYLLRLRIEKAREMIASGSLPLAMIALECGFSSQAHFARTFRRLLGVKPSDYRRNGR